MIRYAKTLARLAAAGGGVGYVPVAAGTVASAVAVAAGAAMLAWTPWALPAAALLAIGGGLWSVGAAEVEGDPGWVVIDEYAGQWIAMLALADASPRGLVAAFLLFRVLDVSKLGPVGWADRQHGAFGVVADDVIAGVIAALALLAIRAAIPGSLA